VHAAFSTALKYAGASTRLAINDYNTGGNDAKTACMFTLLADIVANAGVPYNRLAVGFQSHVSASPGGFSSKAALKANFAKLEALGANAMITELDIKLSSVNSANERYQAAIWGDYLDVSARAPSSLSKAATLTAPPTGLPVLLELRRVRQLEHTRQRLVARHLGRRHALRLERQPQAGRLRGRRASAALRRGRRRALRDRARLEPVQRCRRQRRQHRRLVADDHVLACDLAHRRLRRQRLVCPDALCILRVALLTVARSSAAKYAQCGGQGFTGCTTCASGSTCTYSNPCECISRPIVLCIMLRRGFRLLAVPLKRLDDVTARESRPAEGFEHKVENKYVSVRFVMDGYLFLDCRSRCLCVV
jgi:hypothetical protein